jgi:hypothetical protein
LSKDSRTYGSVSKKFDGWVESEAKRPLRKHLRRVDKYEPSAPRGESEMSRTIFAAIGVGIGVLLLALAVYAFFTAGFYGELGRGGARVGYTIVGFFLLIAGFGGIAATLNHNFRVLTRPGGHH